jgi:hypothetical protein
MSRVALGEIVTDDMVVNGIFWDLPPTSGLDANHDTTVTTADLVAVVLGTEPVPTVTPTVLPTATATATATATPSATGTATPDGLLFAGTVSDLFPHAVGDTLYYEVTDPNGQLLTRTGAVTSSQADGTLTIDIQQGAQHESDVFIDTGTQLSFGGLTDLVQGVRTTCTPSLLRMQMPVIAGDFHSTTATCKSYLVSNNVYIGQFTRTDAFRPIETLDNLEVIAGTFTHVVHISGHTTLSNASDEYYLAPGVGLILQIDTSGQLVTRYELTGGTVGGKPVGQ